MISKYPLGGRPGHVLGEEARPGTLFAVIGGRGLAYLMASILLIDPHLGSGRATARLLACEGHQVMLARSAGEALTALHGRNVDIILLDPALPDMPGEMLLDQLCDEPAWAGCPTLIVSPHSFNRTLWRTTRADLREWMVKGESSGDELTETIERHLPGQRQPSLN